MNSKHNVKWLLSIHFVIWMILALILDIHPDMADHWVWSRYLDWGYYEHPPMVAWMMRAVTLLIPLHPIISLKIGSVAISTFILWLAYRAATSFFSYQTAFIFILILEVTPNFSMGSVFWHIDQPYLICWLVGLIVLSKFIRTKNPNWLLLFGLVAGVGAVSKYITLLFYFSLFFWCLIDRRFRGLFRTWQAYAAGAISFAIFSPVFCWNYVNDWVSFKFQFGRGLSGSSYLGKLPEMTQGHLILFSFIFTFMAWFLLITRRLYPRPTSESNSFLLATTLVPFFFFSISSLRGTIADPRWLNVSYLSLFMLLAEFIRVAIEKKKSRRYDGLFIIAFMANIFILGFVLLQVFCKILPISLGDDNTTKLVGWLQSAHQIESVLKANRIVDPDFVVTREYQLGGALSLYMTNQPLSHSIEKPERNTWSRIDQVQSSTYAVICPPDECKKLLRKVKKRFNLETRFIDTIKTKVNGHLIRELDIYVPNTQKK